MGNRNGIVLSVVKEKTMEETSYWVVRVLILDNYTQCDTFTVKAANIQSAGFFAHLEAKSRGFDNCRLVIMPAKTI
jgi:hypothetical protein